MDFFFYSFHEINSVTVILDFQNATIKTKVYFFSIISAATLQCRYRIPQACLGRLWFISGHWNNSVSNNVFLHKFSQWRKRLENCLQEEKQRNNTRTHACTQEIMHVQHMQACKCTFLSSCNASYYTPHTHTHTQVSQLQQLNPTFV